MAFQNQYINSSARAQGDAQDILGDLQGHFATIPHWEVEAVGRPGGFGVVARIRRTPRHSDGHVERLALKRALAGGHEEELALRNEIYWLKRLRGAEHIVRMVAFRNDEVPPMNQSAGPPSLRRRFTRLLRHHEPPRDYFLQGLTGPVIALEYLANGDFWALIEKADNLQVQLPNRILWSIFLCLVRACIGMAFPIHDQLDEDYDFDAPAVLETIRDDEEPDRISHHDLHLGNIMMGDAGGPFLEHSIIPVTKLIDFGLAQDAGGPLENIVRICSNMMDIITLGRFVSQPSIYNGLITHATHILPTGLGHMFPMLCPNLRDFLARCMAHHEELRPSLAEMLVVAQGHAQRDASSFAPYHERETDEAIQGALSQVVYDAPPEEPEEQQRRARRRNNIRRLIRRPIPARIWRH